MQFKENNKYMDTKFILLNKNLRIWMLNSNDANVF